MKVHVTFTEPQASEALAALNEYGMGLEDNHRWIEARTADRASRAIARGLREAKERRHIATR